MDRIRVLAPTLVAVVTLAGAQGARIGPVSVPEISLRWVAIAIAAAFFSAPRRDDLAPRARHARGAVLLAVTLVGVWHLRAEALRAPLGLDVVMDGSTLVADSLQLDERRDLRRLTGRRRNVSLSLEALLEVPRDGDYEILLDCDDRCTLVVGTEQIRASDTVRLQSGLVPFSLDYRQLGGPARLRFDWNAPAAVELLPMEYFLLAPGGKSRAAERWMASATFVGFALWWGALSAWLVRVAPLRRQLLERRLVPAAAAAAIIIYGSLLRFDALLVHAGLEGHEHLRDWVPGYAIFNPANAPADPYRADVRSYLDRAETFSWSSFYAPSFREPFYIALTLPFLALARGEIGILIQSFVFSSLTLVLVYVIARGLYGAWWALAVLVPVALHEWLVHEAPTGYRMSAYAFFLLAAVAAMFLLPPLRRSGMAAGVLAGLLCLIRLSALSVVLPLLALRLWPLARRDRMVFGGPFLIVFLGLVAPFLVSNAVAHGDPFYSISFHTEFWLRAEGLDTSEGAVSWTRYLTDFGRAGALVKGTLLGMTVLPVKTFWNGLGHFPVVNALTLAAGIAGLFASLGSERRFLTAAYAAHLIPFAYIQNFPSGEMPRFVMPAYFFLVLTVPLAAGSILTPRKGAANVEKS